eukprot:1365210-Amorphochlora_amoeboformis.AAC.1
MNKSHTVTLLLRLCSTNPSPNIILSHHLESLRTLTVPAYLNQSPVLIPVLILMLHKQTSSILMCGSVCMRDNVLSASAVLTLAPRVSLTRNLNRNPKRNFRVSKADIPGIAIA